MKRYGNFSLTEINNMYPYELEIYQLQIIQAMNEEKEK